MPSDEFSEEKQEFAKRLIKAGLNKNLAKTLVFVASKSETKSREIESVTDLRQPEVSIAMQELRDKEWITKRDIKKEGKGRPVHSYSLDKSIDEIISDIEEKEKERIQEIEENLEKINDLIESIY